VSNETAAEGAERTRQDFFLPTQVLKMLHTLRCAALLFKRTHRHLSLSLSLSLPCFCFPVALQPDNPIRKIDSFYRPQAAVRLKVSKRVALFFFSCRA
jgi:hypothetical protein